MTPFAGFAAGASGGSVAVVMVAVAALIVVTAARGTWSPCGLSMVSAVNPLSERARGHRYWVTVLWFVAGAVVGGLGLGAIGAVAAQGISLLAVPTAGAASLAAVCALLAICGDAPQVPLSFPGIPRQVNERWLGRLRRFAYAVGFGAQIGFGLATYVMTSAVYLVPVLGALSGQPPLALACGAAFGAVRGAAILLTVRVREPGQLLRLHRRLAALEPMSMRWVMAVEALAAAAFAAVVGRVPAVLALLIGGLLTTGLRRPQRRTAPWKRPPQIVAAGRRPDIGRLYQGPEGEAHASTHSTDRMERRPAGRVGQGDPGQLRAG